MSSDKYKSQQSKRIIISAYTGLGNFILKTPMILKIKELWPEAKIDLITGNSFGTECVLEGTKLINETHILKMDTPLIIKLKYFLSLRKKNYDAIFLPFDAASKFLMLGTLLMSGTKYAHVNLNLRRKFSQKIWNLICLVGLPGFHFVPWLHGRHEIDLNYDLLEAFYNRPMERTYRTFISRQDDPNVFIRFDLEPGRYVVIQPSAANGGLTAKVWAPKNFEALVNQIHRQYPNLKVVFVGDQGDLYSIRRTSLIDIKTVVNTMGLTSIAELTTIINNAAVVVAHDSGIMHIADALQVKLIALYGPTDYTRTRPLGKNSHILYSRNDCLAAHYNLDVSEGYLAERYPDNQCMEGISVEDLMGKVAELLAIHDDEKSLA